MTADFLAALDAEIVALERQLQALPAFMKLSQLRSVRALYTDLDHHRSGVTLTDSGLAKRHDQRASYKKEHVLRAAAQTLEGRRAPTPTADLHASLAAAGVEIPGAKPRNYLSALLSHDAAFESHGRAGWTLVRVDPSNGNGAGDEPAPSSSFESGSGQEAYPPGRDLLNQSAG